MTDVVRLAARYARALGLPCARGQVASKLSPPYLTGDFWRIPLWGVEEKLGAWSVPDLLELYRQDPEAYVDLLSNRSGLFRVLTFPLHDTSIVVRSVHPLHPLLQPLADEVAHWVDLALRWFWEAEPPEIPVFPGEIVGRIPDERVAAIMAAMQPEIDRETNRERIYYGPGGPYGHPGYNLKLQDLPFERQRRLAEARRFSFYRFGITAEKFRERRWSILEVPCTCCR